jgi:trigger factor
LPVANRRFNPVWDFGAAGFVPGDTVTKSKKRESVSKALPYLLKMGPLGDALAVTPVELPSVKAPSTDDLEVTVPLPADLTQDDLLRRFHELKRQHAKIRERAAGEEVAMGDDVQLDTLGYCEGKLIPFSARFGLWLELAPQPTLPGFSEAIAGEKVGDSLEIELTIPADYPVEALRNKPARFIVDIRAAREVTEPDDEAPAFLKALKKGKTLEDVMDAIRDELEDELADTLTLAGQDLVLDALIERSQAQVPKSLIDEEVRRRWGQLEGKALAERGFDGEEQQEALNAWMTDPLTRTDAERRLKIALVLKAITERDKLKLTPEKLEELATITAAPFGLSAADVKKGLRESKELTAQMAQTGWHMLAVEHVMSLASIKYEGA